jgi:hypothetical protein
MCCGGGNRVVPRWIISVKEFEKCRNKEDFIPITDELLSFRPELKRYLI